MSVENTFEAIKAFKDRRYFGGAALAWGLLTKSIAGLSGATSLSFLLWLVQVLQDYDKRTETKYDTFKVDKLSTEQLEKERTKIHQEIWRQAQIEGYKREEVYEGDFQSQSAAKRFQKSRTKKMLDLLAKVEGSLDDRKVEAIREQYAKRASERAAKIRDGLIKPGPEDQAWEFEGVPTSSDETPSRRQPDEATVGKRNPAEERSESSIATQNHSAAWTPGRSDVGGVALQSWKIPDYATIARPENAIAIYQPGEEIRFPVTADAMQRETPETKQNSIHDQAQNLLAKYPGETDDSLFGSITFWDPPEVRDFKRRLEIEGLPNYGHDLNLAFDFKDM